MRCICVRNTIRNTMLLFHFVERLAIFHRWMFLSVRLRICDHSQHVHGRTVRTGRTRMKLKEDGDLSAV